MQRQALESRLADLFVREIRIDPDAGRDVLTFSEFAGRLRSLATFRLPAARPSFAATAFTSKPQARGVLRTSTFILANRSAFSGLAPAPSQNSAAWSAKASG